MQIFGTLNCVLSREVYYTVSLSRRVHYRRSAVIVFTNNTLEFKTGYTVLERDYVKVF